MEAHSWLNFFPEKGIDALRQSVLLSEELEDTRLKAQEEIKLRDEQILQLKIMLSRAIRERDEAKYKCQKMLFENLLLQKSTTAIEVEDEPRKGIDGFPSSDFEESMVSSPTQVVVTSMPPPPPPDTSAELPIVPNKPLPMKGKLLQAVIEAGPLLQTLLLAGPLPQWHHPPPPFDTHQIPPSPAVIPAPPLKQTHPIHQESSSNITMTSNVNNCGKMGGKKGPCFEFAPSIEPKYRTVGLLH